jgi:hypothetical protein
MTAPEQPMVLTPPPDFTQSILTEPVAPQTEQSDLLMKALQEQPQAQETETPESPEMPEDDAVSAELTEVQQPEVVDMEGVQPQTQPQPEDIEFGEVLPTAEEPPAIEQPMPTPVMTKVDIAAMKAYIEEALKDPNHPYHAELSGVVCPLCESQSRTAQTTLFGNLLNTLREGPAPAPTSAPEPVPEPVPETVSVPEPRPAPEPVPELTTPGTVPRPSEQEARTAFQRAFDNVFRNPENSVGKAVNRIAGNLADVQTLFGFGSNSGTETPQTGGSKSSKKLDLLMGPRGDVVLQGEYKPSRTYHGANEASHEKAKKTKTTRRHKMVKSGSKKLRLTKRRGAK